MKTAHELYDIMLDNYWRSARDGEDTDKCYNAFVIAAISLAKLNKPNPFADEELHVNAAIKPGCGSRVVTSVVE